MKNQQIDLQQEEKTMETQEYLSSLVAASRVAQKEFEKYDQATVDKAVKAIGKAIYDNIQQLHYEGVI